ncbi:hypothetical protein LEN26_012314 [Aphanomyces euteiches]|nr:hypothetical protein AeMF1_019957 [Aphanomyces euteiches]KAH9111789.1 hypothetical protein AeMF1_013782 [Aphanomyces euteiches]KAH9117962.1 hypothetical protein LEN26_012314 [Aphanomyces euteiches]KAH9118458.1 hypothetical protein AeMF1_008407 [Aphanomyces euteiches]KAH9121924.1 hypothetical protein AeMF1_006564 [Aphanomyces euteiches]
MPQSHLYQQLLVIPEIVMSVRFPVRQDFFKCPPLSPVEIFQYKQMATKCVQEVIAKANMANPAYEWTLASDEIDFKLYKGRSTASSALHCGQIEVVGTVDEVVELFRTDTTEQARFYCQRTQRNLVDAVNLYTILAPTAETPHDKIQIKWIVGKSTLSGLFKQRDFCCLEATQELQIEGRRMWVRAYKSIELDCCPDFKSTLGLVRGSINGSGHVFIESKERSGYLSMSYVNDFTVNGSAPDWAAEHASQSRCRNVLDIDRFLRENRLNQTPFLPPTEWDPPSKWHSCHVCEKKFGMLLKKTNCTKCGHVSFNLFIGAV